MKKRYFIAIAILLLFCIVLFVLTHFSNATILSTEGYFVTGEKIEEILLSDAKVNKAKNIKMQEVTYEDNFYNNLGKLYIGEDKKTEVNSNYPIYSNDGLALVNINEKSKLINSELEFFSSYENFTLTDGKLYNYGDFEQADYENYVFLQLPNGTYANLYEVNISAITKEIVIPVNSIVYFDDNFLRYFSYSDKGKLVYHIEEAIDLASEVTMGEVKFTYKEWLQVIGKVEKDSSSDSDDELVEDSEADNDDTSSEKKYVKPKVSVEDFSANVYSAISKLRISDSSGVIVGGVNFEFKIGDKIFLRKTFVSSGTIEVIGLVPNTEFTIIGSYKYYNENGKKMEHTFFEQKIKTGSPDKLPEIKLGFENGPIYSNKIEVKNLRILSDLDNEAINGISKAIIYINGENYSISKSLINDMTNGNSGDYISPSKLASNTTIDYEIKLLDAFDNDIKVTNNRGKTRTSKKEPTVTLSLSKSTVTSTFFDIKLKNEDSVNINNYRYVIYDNTNAIVLSHDMNSLEQNQTIELTNLDPSVNYVIKVLGDYDIEDGNGVVEDAVLGESKFTTKSLSSLGYVRVKSGLASVDSSSATLESYIDISAVSNQLLELINTFKMVITDAEDEVVYERVFNEENINEVIGGEAFTDYIADLCSGDVYYVTFYATAKQGSVEEDIPVLCTFKSFTISRAPAVVNMINIFVTGNMIDFDVRIDDLDGSIVSDRVILEVRDNNGKLISTEYLDINSDYVRLTYNKLTDMVDYSFTYKVEEYNEGYDNRTFQSDYTIFEKQITTVSNIRGSIQLTSLLRQIESSNLFNISDFSRMRKEGNIGYKDYDLENNVMILGAKNGYVNYSYFVPEAYGDYITISFYARYAPETQNKAAVYLAKDQWNTQSYLLSGLSDEYQKYSFSFSPTSNYIGFLISESSGANTRTDVELKNIVIKGANSYVEEVDIKKSYHESGYIFTNAVMIAGNKMMPNYDGTSTMTGNSGDGYAKITNLTTNEVKTFRYTGDYQTFTPSSTGKYKIQLWGGGSTGKGAYTSGEIELTAFNDIYVYVGQGGKQECMYDGLGGGWNGGANPGVSGCSRPGAGATDVRLVSGAWNNLESLKSRIMVAGGGGGAENNNTNGYGGALTGGPNDAGSCATQNFGSAFGYALAPTYDASGAGGGYYGGISATKDSVNAGGGSSYISGYKGCVAYHNTVTQNDSYIKYSEKDKYMGTFNIDLYDDDNQIITNDFYIRVYSGGQLVDSVKYDLIEGAVTDFIANYEFGKNKNFSVKLAVKMGERYYDISSVSFDSTAEIRSITSANQISNLHTDAKYIVLNDITFMRVANFQSMFYGEIDFQGHTVYTNVQDRGSNIIWRLGASGVIKNVVLDYTIDNTSSRYSYYGLVGDNYGTIDNIIINVNEEATQNPNYNFTLGVNYNYGTIKNFVINSKGQFSASAAAGLLVWYNCGIIQNGYVYGKNINVSFENVDRGRKDIGPIAGYGSGTSVIKNVFSLVAVDKESYLVDDKEYGFSNILGSANGNSRIENAYSVEDPEDIESKLISSDPNIGTDNGSIVDNLYYVSDQTYAANKSSKISKLALWDIEFQNGLLNTDNAFDVKNYVSMGYYPQVKMNDCMPRQEFISLPKLEATDLLDVTSSEQVEVGGDYAIVDLYLNNPGAETINEVGISDIGKVEIISQENTYGKTTLRVKLSSPAKYTSKYSVMLLKYTSVMGITGEVTYQLYERPIDVDLYYPIYTLNDWKMINTNPNQNYILMNDLDFGSTTIKEYIITKTFEGKLNGNNKTIKNINILSNDYLGFFNGYLHGTIENLNVLNYKKTGSNWCGAFIYRARNGAVIDNVHIKNAEIYSNEFLGGLVAYSDNSTIIRNSSVTNLIGRVASSVDIIGFRAGGLVGYMYNGDISNSYVQNVDFEFGHLLLSHGIGGIAGEMSSGYIDNVYATGVIKTNSNYTGGIAGISSASISRVWTGINISSELDYIGGVLGFRSSELISNTLVVGDIYSSYQGENINRTVGNLMPAQQNNFAWDGQKVYGMLTNTSQVEKLLSIDDLSDSDTYTSMIVLGDHFDYSNINGGIMPKLKNSETGELLPNQEDYVLVEEYINVDSIDIDGTIDEAQMVVKLDNPNNYEITELLFDYLNVVSSNGASLESGKMTFNLSVTPKYYYDSYTLTGVKYINEKGEEKVAPLYTRIEKSFYRQIYDVDDWLEIATRDTPENYMLKNDLDFSPEANNGRTIKVPSGLKIARLESDLENQNRVIKNASVTVSASGNGMIKVLTKSLSNVTFENINISTYNSSSSSYPYINYIGVIAFNNSNIKNLELKNIVVDALNSNYTGFIAYNDGQDIRYVKMNGDFTQDSDGNDVYSYKVKGRDYTGGFIGYSRDRDTYHIEANNIYVYSNGTYVGGIIGYKPYNYTCNDYYYVASNMNVSAWNNAGGMFGYGVANGSTNADGTISYSVISDSKIQGLGGSYTGAMSGQAGHYTSMYIKAINNTVSSVGSSVGGLFGWSYDIQYCYVYSSTIINNGGSNTGGITGTSGYSTYYSGVYDTTITSTGSSVGGLFGYKDGGSYYNFTENVVVSGKNNVGGAVGYAWRLRLRYNSINADITATGSNCGGLIGIINDIDPESVNYSSQAYENILVNSNITSTGDRVGFFAGSIPMQLQDAYHYENILVANMTITDTANYGLLTGYDTEYHLSPTKVNFIYENNQIIKKSADEIVSTEYVKDITDFEVTNFEDAETKARMMPSANTLRLESYYTGIGFSSSYWVTSWTNSDGTTTNVSDGYYPRNKQSLSANPVFELPTGDVTYNLRNMAFSFVHELPEVEVYSSGVNTLNIDFSDVDEYTYFEVYENDKKVFEQPLNKKTYSITYNYKSDLKIVVMDGVNTRNYTFKGEDLVNKVTSFDNKYAYIYDEGNLIGNIKETDEKFIHVYGTQALTDDLKIYDLVKESIISFNNEFNVSLLTNSIPLYNFEYEDVLVDTYATYSVIHKIAGDLIFESQIFVKDGVLEIVDGQLDNVKNSVIIDEYAKDNYVTILGTDGVIYNLKESIKTPSGFANKNIKYMSNNINSKSSIVVVMYETGKVVVFDYRTGKKVQENKATEDVSVVDYFKENLSKNNSILNNSKLLDSYDEALELKKNLEKDPILTTMNGEYITQSSNEENSDNENKVDVLKFDNNYVTYYNAVKGSYDVINVDGLIEGKDSEIVSENDKIYSSNDFVDLYMQESVFEKVFGDDSIVIFVIILIGIVGSLGLWFTNIRKLKES